MKLYSFFSQLILQISGFFASFSILTANLFIVVAAALIRKYIDAFCKHLAERLVFLGEKAEINFVLQVGFFEGKLHLFLIFTLIW